MKRPSQNPTKMRTTKYLILDVDSTIIIKRQIDARLPELLRQLKQNDFVILLNSSNSENDIKDAYGKIFTESGLDKLIDFYQPRSGHSKQKLGNLNAYLKQFFGDTANNKDKAKFYYYDDSQLAIRFAEKNNYPYAYKVGDGEETNLISQLQQLLKQIASSNDGTEGFVSAGGGGSSAGIFALPNDTDSSNPSAAAAADTAPDSSP